MKFLTFTPLWLGAVSWHLWRILTCRPAFKQIGDTVHTAVSFAVVFMAAGLLRWSVLGDYRLVEVLCDLVLHGVFLVLLTERRHRSSALAFAVLGVSASVDLMVSALYLAGVFPSVSLPGYSNLAIQSALSIAAYVQFRREPTEVQARGYRSPGKASVMKV